MDKAYDFKDLVLRVKAQGLDITEEAAKMVTEQTINWLSDSAVVSKTPFDNLLIPFYPIIKSKLIEVEDKIDGKVG